MSGFALFSPHPTARLIYAHSKQVHLIIYSAKYLGDLFASVFVQENNLVSANRKEKKKQPILKVSYFLFVAVVIGSHLFGYRTP